MDLYAIAETIVKFMNGGPGFFAGLLYITIAALPVVLLHEFGHALMAVRRLGTDVEVTVGGAGRIAQFRLGQINASLFALQGAGATGGSAAFDASRASARDVLWIALAGPAASLLGLVVAMLCFANGPVDGFLHDLLWAAVFTSFAGVANLVPITFDADKPGESYETDGRIALSALRVISELR